LIGPRDCNCYAEFRARPWFRGGRAETKVQSMCVR